MQEQREAERYTFGVEQRIAGVVEGRPPEPDGMETVRCIDLSRDGFAFYYPRRPDFQQLAIALGIEPDIVWMAARIVHVEMIELCGSLVFRVGCRFTEQLRLDDAVSEAWQRARDANSPLV
jgi:hypothetical protein